MSCCILYNCINAKHGLLSYTFNNTNLHVLFNGVYKAQRESSVFRRYGSGRRTKEHEMSPCEPQAFVFARDEMCATLCSSIRSLQFALLAYIAERFTEQGIFLCCSEQNV